MKPISIKVYVFTFVLALQFILIPSINAHGLDNILDKPGGSGSSGNVASDDGNSNTGLYILAGVAVAAILIYKFILEEPSKGESEKEGEESKETSFLEPEENISNYREAFPIDVYIGMKNNFPNLQDQSVVMGVAIKF